MVRHHLPLGNAFWLFQITTLTFTCLGTAFKRIRSTAFPGNEVRADSPRFSGSSFLPFCFVQLSRTSPLTPHLVKTSKTSPPCGTKIYLARLGQWRIRSVISVAWPRKGSYPRTCRPRCFCLTCFAAADANTFCFRYRGAATFHSFSCKACKRKPRNDDKYLVQSRNYNAGLAGFGSREDALSLGSTPTGWVKKCLLCF